MADRVHRVFKQDAPEVTIHSIRGKLQQLGIFPFEESWMQAGPFWAVRIQDPTIGFGTNGKGISRLWALASAYGEFMERLQNGIAFEKNQVMLREFPLFIDEARVDFERYADFPEDVRWAIAPEGFPPAFEGDLREHGIKTNPYYDVFNHRVVQLPVDLLLSVTGTNGLCAGNSPEEAITQGLCEVAERYALRRLHMEVDCRLPSIPMEAVEDLPIVQMAQHFAKEKGYTVLIKDMSFGNFPVVLVILGCTETGQYAYSVGSAPQLSTAIERCLTEAFQGHLKAENTVDVSSRQPDFDDPILQRSYDFLLSAQSWGRPLPPHALISSVSEWNPQVFMPTYTTPKEALAFVLGAFSKAGRSIYIRDVSFLQFPAYAIFVPGMSEMLRLGRDKVFMPPRQGRELASALAGLDHLTQEEALALAETIERLLAYPGDRAAMGTLLARHGVKSFAGKCDFFLALLFMRGGNAVKAHRYLDRDLSKSESLTAYESACRAYLKLKSQGVPENNIHSTLIGLFGEESAQEVLGDLADPDRAFAYSEIPNCPNCDCCRAQESCTVRSWPDVIKRMRTHMENNPIRQEGLREVFADVLAGTAALT